MWAFRVQQKSTSTMFLDKKQIAEDLQALGYTLSGAGMYIKDSKQHRHCAVTMWGDGVHLYCHQYGGQGSINLYDTGLLKELTSEELTSFTAVFHRQFA